MMLTPLQVYDIIETPGFAHPRLYSVEGIHYGATDQEDVVEISAVDRSNPDAHGKKQSMFVPNEMIQAGISSGLFKLTRA